MCAKQDLGRCDRSRLHYYPTDLTEEERTMAELLIASAKGGGRERTIGMRKTINALTDVPGSDWSDGKVTIHPYSASVDASPNQLAETSHGR